MVLTAARRAGRRVKIALAASLVLLVLSAAYLTVTLRYELTYGNFRGHPGADSRVDAGNVTEYRYLARPSRTIEYGFSIANHGPLTIRLDEMINYNPYIVEPVRVDADLDDGVDGSDAVPFRPMDLRPDGQVGVWVTMRLPEAVTDPDAACGAFGFDTQRVRFTVLGMPREQNVPIGYAIKVVIPEADGQPCASSE